MIYPYLLPRRVTALLIASLVFVGVVSAETAGSIKKPYNVPPGDAATTLKQFSEQSGEQIVYPVDSVRGFQTKAVKGDLTSRSALDTMLAGTGLAVVSDEKTGAFAIRVVSTAQQSSASAAGAAKTARIPTAAEVNQPTVAGANDAVQMSPFEVNTEKDQGYTATNSLAGTRLNSKLEDLAASISVVTKQQLDDTAAIDINDIFLFEANTEGMQQYTEFTIDRSFYNENTTLNPQSSNRIRGIGSANISTNNFATSGVVPVDTYILDSVEISRGPNSNIFGLGNAAGTVNLVTGDARVDRNISQIASRGDSSGGWRASANFNRVLVKDRLAIRAAYLHDEKGFERKPSYENTNRLFASLTARPFKSTTLRLAYESYNNHFSRQNTTLPRDSISDWLASDRPVWNPSYTTGGATGAWRPLNGTTYTPVTTANEATLPITLLPGSGGFWNNPSVFIEGNGAVSFYGMNAAANTLTNPAPPGSPVYRYVETGSVYRRTTTTGTPLILFQVPSIRDKSIYDWTSTNILSPNYGRDQASTYRAELNQGVFNTPRQRLDVQLGAYKEVIDRYDHAVFSRSDSGIPYVVVDVNETLLDGSTNPNFLRPYMAGSQPTIGYRDERNLSTRASLAYQLDFSNEENWKKWAGKHSLLLYGERRDILNTNLSGRDLNVSNYSWSSANDVGSLPLRGNTYRLYPRYYLGGRVNDAGRVVDNAPATKFSLGSTPFTWYTSARTRVDEQATIREIIQSGNSRDREIRSKGVIWQGFFLKDKFGDGRIVPTIGWRDDRNRERSSRNLNANLNATTTINSDTHLHDLSWVKVFPTPWEEKAGQSRTQGVVVKPFRWLNLNYNQSDSFKPETLAYNINGELLPNPTGKTKDYGVTLKLFNEKLVARVTHYDTVEKNSRNGSITSAAVTRTLRLFYDPSSSNAIVGTTVPATPVLANGSDAFDLEQSATQWILGSNPTFTIDQAREMALNQYLKPLGIDGPAIDRVRLLGASAFTDVNTVTSTGTEVELTFNPTRNWTMKLAGAQQKAVDTELGNAVNDYVNSRLVAAKAIVIPSNDTTRANGTAGKFWWSSGQSSTNTNSPANFYVANVKSVVGLATANAGKPRAQTREYRANFTTNYRLAGMFQDNWLKNASVGGSIRWSSKAALGYYGAAPSTDPEYRGAIVEYDANRPIYDKPRAEFDLMASYNLRLWNEKVRCRIQLNVRNLTESGRLQPISYNPDGQAWNYRIVDPRQFILSATFDL